MKKFMSKVWIEIKDAGVCWRDEWPKVAIPFLVIVGVIWLIQFAFWPDQIQF